MNTKDEKKTDEISAGELTITFACYHYPVKMLEKLKKDRGITAEKKEAERNMCDALKELFADDIRESKNEGKMEGKIEQTIKKYKKGCTIEQTADMLEESPVLIGQIYDILAQHAPDYNVEQIYQELIKQPIT